MVAAVEPEPLPEVSALPVADRLAVARAALAAVGQPTAVAVAPVVQRQPCPYTEYDGESGETYRCGLSVHGPKVKHTRGARV